MRVDEIIFLLSICTVIILSSVVVVAIDFTPQGDVNLKNYYSIKNVGNISLNSTGDLYINNIGQKKFWYNHTSAAGNYNYNQTFPWINGTFEYNQSTAFNNSMG